MLMAHALAAIPPRMSEQQFLKLRDDIKSNGLLAPIILFNGQILDGRHRHRACAELGIEPKFVQFDGSEDEAARYVYSTNCARRHSTTGQLAASAVKFEAWFAEKAKERMLAGVSVDPPENSTEGRGDSRDAAAALVGVSNYSVSQAKAVMKAAIPEVIELLESGAMSLHEASVVSKLAKPVQKKIAGQSSKKARTESLRKHKNLSAGRRSRDRLANADANIKPASDAPGTQLVRQVLFRLEGFSNDIERSGMSAQEFAACFVSEFQWSEPLLASRLGHCFTAIDAISALSVIAQRAQRQAA